MKSEKNAGRRYSRRTEHDGLVQYDADGWHRFSGAPARYKKLALDYLAAHDIPANEIIARSNADGNLNEGAALREYMSCIPGTEIDDTRYLAARLYEIARIVEVVQDRPDLARPGEVEQRIFELGRVSALAEVYRIDDGQRADALAARHKETLQIAGVGEWATTAGKHAAAVRDVAAMKASYPDKQMKAIYADVARRYEVTVGTLKNWCSKANKK